MLFKITDSIGKLIEYTSVCIPEEKLTQNSILYNSFQTSNNPILKKITRIHTNGTLYTTEAISASCCLEHRIYIYINEMLSERRAKQINAKKKEQYLGDYVDGYNSLSNSTSFNIKGFTNTSNTATISNYVYVPHSVSQTIDGYGMRYNWERR